MTSEKERLYIARPCSGKEMVNICGAAGCSNTPSDRVSLLKLPRDGVLRHMGRESTADLNSMESYQALMVFCSDRFTEDLFRGGVGSYGGLGWREGSRIPNTCCEVAAGGW